MNHAERGNNEGGRNRGGRKRGKPSKAKRVVLNRYSSAMKKRTAQRKREAAAAAARGITFQLGDTVARGENDATEYSLWGQVKATSKAAKAAIAARKFADAAEADAKAALTDAESRMENRELTRKLFKNNLFIQLNYLTYYLDTLLIG